MAMDFPTSAAIEPTTTTATTTPTDNSAVANNVAAMLRRTSLSQSFAGSSSEPATAELARSLPELIEQLTLLRGEMAKSAKIYDAIAAGDVKTHQPASSSSTMRNSNSNSNSNSDATATVSAGRQSLFTPFAGDTPPEAYAPIERESSALELHDLAGGAALQRNHSKRGGPPSYQPAYPQYQLPRSDSRRLRQGDYTVMWVSGECGISLRNFSTNKIGAQIAVLQQAEGVTTGIANCRLGDQLVTVNDDPVETSSFRAIVEKLKTTRRPITLGFRTNPNVATSPVAGPSMRTRHSNGNGGKRADSTRSFFPADDARSTSSSAPVSAPPAYARTSSTKYDADVMATAAAAIAVESEERTTDASVRSSTSTLSDEVESWCKEQEEMHSGLLVLLTETVLRCERLQQENMDQLQNWMQVAPSLYASHE